ncbi:glypican-5b isoform X1 [Hemiscyllium ocellatum]|uniref:glypican-5b isoform X1 n=1 Tax=Hemiscyllium ocellatum TaxID=170820 RepID=UPI0029677895|nr:glypican-5b isoform X1 [Hemiscyllium ocellatum]
MECRMRRLQWVLPLSLLLGGLTGVHLKNPSCHEVRTAFQLRQIGPLKFVPDFPGKVEDLQICTHDGPTCCTKRMEEKYQAVVRREVLQSIHFLSYELKYRIEKNGEAFQEAFISLIHSASNHTNSMFKTGYRTMAKEATEVVKGLFTDLSLYVLDTSWSIEDMVLGFFDNLFPLVYNRLIHPGLNEVSLDYLECLRSARQNINPFGSYPMKMVAEIAEPLQAMKTLLQVLNIGSEVINMTKNIVFTRECTRALVKMQYCSHCHGLTLIKPCVAYCLNVMRGCLANVADVDPHWQAYISNLNELTSIITGPQGVELALLRVAPLVNEAILHAQLNGPEISTTVGKVCDQTQERSIATSQENTAQVLVMPSFKPQAVTPYGTLAQRRSSLPLKEVKTDRPRTMKKNSRDFMNYIRRHRTFYASMAEQICEDDLRPHDSSTCWNGVNVVESYTNRVVGNGLKEQANNPEVKVRGPDAMVKKVIDKLVQIDKMLHGKRSKQSGQWSSREPGSGDDREEDSESSGDCDDEDGCTGSGSGEVGRKKNTDVPEERWTKDHIYPGMAPTLKGAKVASPSSTPSSTAQSKPGAGANHYSLSTVATVTVLGLMCHWLL